MRLDAERLLAVHKRLTAGDPTASADLIELAYDGLTGYIRSKHGWNSFDEDKAKTMALDVLAHLVEHPESYDPTKGMSVPNYLFMALNGDVANDAATSLRRAKIMSRYVVEVRDVGGKSFTSDPSTRIDAEAILSRHRDEIVKTPEDEIVLDLMLDDESDSDVYARALELDGLPPDERSHEVKKRKDKIEARLRRLGKRL